MPTYPKVLLISDDEMEASVLEGILTEHVVLRNVRDLAELQTALGKGSYDALFCGWSFRHNTWSDTLKQIQQRCPDLPVIVFSRTAGEREWLQVIEAGGFDLLTAPYLMRHVLPVLQHAVVSHEARRMHHNAASYSSEVMN